MPKPNINYSDGRHHDFEVEPNKAYTAWLVDFKRTHGHDPSPKTAFDFGRKWQVQWERFSEWTERWDD